MWPPLSPRARQRLGRTHSEVVCWRTDLVASSLESGFPIVGGALAHETTIKTLRLHFEGSAEGRWSCQSYTADSWPFLRTTRWWLHSGKAQHRLSPPIYNLHVPLGSRLCSPGFVGPKPHPS